MFCPCRMGISACPYGVRRSPAPVRGAGSSSRTRNTSPTAHKLEPARNARSPIAAEYRGGGVQTSSNPGAAAGVQVAREVLPSEWLCAGVGALISFWASAIMSLMPATTSSRAAPPLDSLAETTGAALVVLELSRRSRRYL